MKTKIRMNGGTTGAPTCVQCYKWKLPCCFCTQDVKIEVYK